ncbi:MAG: outer membrane beta-barrel protein [Fluviicola sp.]
MKRLLFGLAMIALSTSANAQDAAGKKYQAGLVTGFGMNFQEMGTTRMASLGVGSDVTLGANVNIGLTETIAFTTGAEFDFERLRFNNGPNPVYYWYTDKQILQRGEVGNATNPQLFQLIERRQRVTYLTIPTMLMFRTNFIGYFRYFGKFGLRNSILLSNKYNDTGVNFEDMESPLGTPTQSLEQENMEAGGEMLIFKSAVGAAGGAEWNFIGSTCLVAELGFYYGFTPLFLDRDEDKTTLFTSGANNGQGNDIPFSNQARQSQLMLKISILF